MQFYCLKQIHQANSCFKVVCLCSVGHLYKQYIILTENSIIHKVKDRDNVLVITLLRLSEEDGFIYGNRNIDIPKDFCLFVCF